MIIAVTGGTGYIGSILVSQLLKNDDIVRLLAREPSKLSQLEKAYNNIQIVKGDISDIESLRAAFEDVDQVYHMAAYANAWAKDPSVFYDVNTKGTENVMIAAKDRGVKKVVYTSTAGVFGYQDGGHLINEKKDYTKDPFTHYETSKILAEQIVKKFCNVGLNVSIVNPTRVYGPGKLGVSNAATLLMKRYIDNQWHIIPGDGKNVGNYVFVDDVVVGHILAMKKGKSGENYLISGENLNYDEFFALIAEITDIKRLMVHVVDFWAELIAAGISLYSLFSYSEKHVDADWVKRYLKDWGIDGSKAFEELGYQPKDVKEGFTQTINWIIEQKQNNND